jgi:hypothetical protein
MGAPRLLGQKMAGRNMVEKLPGGFEGYEGVK